MRPTVQKDFPRGRNLRPEEVGGLGAGAPRQDLSDEPVAEREGL